MRHRIAFFSPRAVLRRVLVGTALLLLATAASGQGQSFRWTTIAGGDVRDGLPAHSAVVAYPIGIVYDAEGYAYVSQWRENRIRKITPGGGLITTLAGDGSMGFAGDGGTASDARFKHPAGLAIDGAGNLYVADSGNHRIRRITPTGQVSTIAGNGQAGYDGDGGLAVNASLNEPYGLAFDGAGNLYVSDWQAHVVRKITPAGKISTVAGTGVAGFSGNGGPATAAQLNLPEGISFDAAGNLYIADSVNQMIRRVTPGGVISTVAGDGEFTSDGDGGPATQASILYPYNVVVGSDGALYIADSRCYIRKVVDGVINRYAGDGGCEYHGENIPATSAGMGAVEGMAFDLDGNLRFADAENGRIRRISKDTGLIQTVAGMGTFDGDGGPATAAALSWTLGIAVGPNGTIYVADALHNRRIRGIGADSGTIFTVAGTGTFGSSQYDGQPAIAHDLYHPKGVAARLDGSLLIADRGANRVLMVDAGGFISTFAGNGSSTASGDGDYAIFAGMDPAAVVADRLGNTYIADYVNHRIRKVDTNGIVSTVAGTGVAGFGGDGGPATAALLRNPYALAVDAENNLLIADTGNYRVRKLRADGSIQTIAGNGGIDGSGDGGPATAAALERIAGIGMAPDGTLYVAAGTRLRRVTTDGRIHAIPSFVYGAMDVAFDAEGALLVTTESGRVVRGEVHARVRSDFNNDGRSDVFWRNFSTGANTIWLAANAAWKQPVAGVGNLAWRIDAVGDFDGNGKADLLWRNHANGQNVIWIDGDATRRTTLPAILLAWEVVASGDFDGDGNDDIMWRHSGNGANAVWRSANAATQLPQMGVTNLAWKVAGAGDFDGDGRADVLWRNDQTGANTIWKGGNGGTPIATTGVTNLAWKVVGIGDFDGDGTADIFWRNIANGMNTIWKGGRSSTPQPTTAITNLAWEVVAVPDYNGDGRSDVLWRNRSNGANAIWRSGSFATQQPLPGVSNQAWKVVD